MGRARASCSRPSLDLGPLVESNHAPHQVHTTTERPRVSVSLETRTHTRSKQKHVGFVRSAPNLVPCAQRLKYPETAPLPPPCGADRSGAAVSPAAHQTTQTGCLNVLNVTHGGSEGCVLCFFLFSGPSQCGSVSLLSVWIHRRWMSCAAFMDFLEI